MSITALTLTAYLTALDNNIREGNWQANTNSETAIVIDYQQQHIPFRYKQWQLINQSICADRNTQSNEYTQCTKSAKVLFKQLCTALNNQANKQQGHQQFQQMYCQAAINFQPKVSTITYGKDAIMTPQEKRCNQLILKVMVEPTKALINERNNACKDIK